MCGIAGFYVRKPMKTLSLDKLADALLAAIDHRGGDATGLAAFGDAGCLLLEKATCDAKRFTLGRDAIPKDTVFALLHTRFATQGDEAFARNNHPVENRGIYAIHNGHITNDHELWKEAGWKHRAADVDSEIVPAMIATLGWDAIPEALAKMEGSLAVALASNSAPGELILARGDTSPLYLCEGRDLIVWASTVEAIRHAWAKAIGTPPKNIRSLSQGEIVYIKDGRVSGGKFKVPFFHRMLIPNTAGNTKKTKAISSYDLQAWGWEQDEIDDFASELRAEIDRNRAQVDSMLAEANSDPKWWDIHTNVAKLTTLWDRIRTAKDDLEELTWQATFPDDKEADDSITFIACDSCKEMVPVESMKGSETLYCSECWDFFLGGIEDKEERWNGSPASSHAG